MGFLGGGWYLVQGFFWVLIFASIQSFPSLEIWSALPGLYESNKAKGHYVREMREEKSKAPCHMLCMKCPIGLTWPIKCLSCRLALSFSFFNIYFSIDVDKYKDILPHPYSYISPFNWTDPALSFVILLTMISLLFFFFSFLKLWALVVLSMCLQDQQIRYVLLVIASHRAVKTTRDAIHTDISYSNSIQE